MARIRVRYLVCQPGADGALPRWFWQPSSALRAQGWRPERVPADWGRHSDAAALEAAAIARAQELNAQLDAMRSRAGAAQAGAVIAPAARTLADLVRDYQVNGNWQRLAPATRRGYAQCIARLTDWAGDAPVRAIQPPQVQRLMRQLAATPTFANAIVRVLRLLLEHGRRQGWVASNAALRPGLTAAEPSGLIWPHDAVTAFVAAADAMGRPSIGTAVLLNEWLGQREGDVLRMPRTVLRGAGVDRRLVLRQSKTGAGVTLPVGMVPALADRLAAELARWAGRLPQPTTIIVSEETALPYKPDNFRHVFAAIRAKAAETHPHFEIDHLLPGRDMTDPDAFRLRMRDLTFMQLRHTAVTRLAEAGCDVPLIASVTGHSQETVTALMKRYMVRTGEMTRTAFGKRMAAESVRGAG